MSRHPYTYADDYVRHLAGFNEKGTILGRSDASKIIEGIASVLSMTHEDLATKLSLYYQEHQTEIADEDSKAFLPYLLSVAGVRE